MVFEFWSAKDMAKLKEVLSKGLDKAGRHSKISSDLFHMLSLEARGMDFAYSDGASKPLLQACAAAPRRLWQKET